VFEAAYENGTDGGDVLNRLLYVDTKVYLPDDILVKVDRMSMACSLEARVPLLDHRVIEFAAQLPTALKQRGTEGKVLFRQAVADLLPPEIRRRKKAGFNVPASRWLKGPLREMVGDYLSESQLRDAGVFSPSAVEKVLEAHRSGQSDRSRELFGLLMFHVWHRHVFKQSRVGA
jgi:asparagine synthase (glutamine-hydrolysing)